MTIDFTAVQTFNESDVEQKIIYPLMVSEQPYGLGYEESSIKTKTTLKSYNIDKGNDKKIYHPDYLILINGWPTIIIEAKYSNKDIEKGYKEARLYANEVNSTYDTGVNPIVFVFSISEEEVWVGNVDNNKPISKYEIKKFFETSESLNEFSIKYGKTALLKIQKKLYLNELKYTSPIKGNLSEYKYHEKLKNNSFGSNISLNLKSIFNPNPRNFNERRFIVENAYVHTEVQDSQLQPIERLLRKLSKITYKKFIETNEKKLSDVLLEKLNENSLVNQLILLIGKVGGGKSTFLDYFYHKQLKDSIKDKFIWIYLNLNNLPPDRSVSKDLILDSAINEICDNQNIDIYDYNVIKKVFKEEVSKFEKGPAKVLTKSSVKREKLYEKLNSLLENKELVLKQLVKYLFEMTNKQLVIVFDNCDKKTEEQQIETFEITQYLLSIVPCTIFLPIRESTYESYKDQPPLDTAIHDLIFHIDPPPFYEILISRINCIFQDRINKNSSTFKYRLKNNIEIEVPAEEQSYYLASVLKSVTTHSQFISKVLLAMTDRNVRKSMEIFLEICRSGYIDEDYIHCIKAKNGDYEIPFHLLLKVILKSNRKYYSSKKSFIKNVFSESSNGEIRYSIIKYSILCWFYHNKIEKGDMSERGVFFAKSVIADLELIGFNSNISINAIQELYDDGCLFSESLNNHLISRNELISLSASGTIHYQISQMPDYLMALTEELSFNDEMICEELTPFHKLDEKDRWTIKNILNVSELLSEYIKESISKALTLSESYSFNNVWGKILKYEEIDGHINKLRKIKQENM